MILVRIEFSKVFMHHRFLTIPWQLAYVAFCTQIRRFSLKSAKNAIHAPILAENWWKTTRFYRFWAKIGKNDAFSRVFTAFLGFRIPKSRKKPQKRVVFANFGPKSMKTRCFPPIFTQNRRMYRVFVASTSRRLVFDAHFVKKRVQTQVSEGSRDKKHLKYDVFFRTDRKVTHIHRFFYHFSDLQ